MRTTRTLAPEEPSESGATVVHPQQRSAGSRAAPGRAWRSIVVRARPDSIHVAGESRSIRPTSGCAGSSTELAYSAELALRLAGPP